jgi:hypothetical protein
MVSQLFERLRSVIGALLCAAVLSACAGGSSAVTSTPQTAKTISAATGTIGHVFVIMLENKSYSETFGGNTAAPYLAQTLASQGAMLTNYYGTGHVSLDNYISFLSGQSPTVQTDNDCTTGYGERAHPGRSAGRGESDLERLHGRHGQRSGP